MATLKIINNFEITVNGITWSGKQGSTDDAATEEFEFTVTGNVHSAVGSLATATIRTIWDEDDDEPDDIAYFWFWADVDMYVQVIAQATHFIVKCEAKIPWSFNNNTVLGAASTTAITGGTEPTLSAVDSIVIGNYTGGTGNYVFAAIE